MLSSMTEEAAAGGQRMDAQWSEMITPLYPVKIM